MRNEYRPVDNFTELPLPPTSGSNITLYTTKPNDVVTITECAYWMWGLDVRCSRCSYKVETTGLPDRCPCCGALMINE